MRHLFDYGEGLFCFLPVFMMIALVFGALIWNSLPDRTVKKTKKKERDDE